MTVQCTVKYGLFGCGPAGGAYESSGHTQRDFHHGKSTTPCPEYRDAVGADPTLHPQFECLHLPFQLGKVLWNRVRADVFVNRSWMRTLNLWARCYWCGKARRRSGVVKASFDVSWTSAKSARGKGVMVKKAVIKKETVVSLRS